MPDVATQGNHAIPRFSHLNPLGQTLSQQLLLLPLQPEVRKSLRDCLVSLGLNVYPSEDSLLLQTMAEAWEQKRIATEQYAAFIGQLHDAWKRFDTTKPLPTKFLIPKGVREFEVVGRESLKDVYFPDDKRHTRVLRTCKKRVLEVCRPNSDPPNKLKENFESSKYNIQFASKLKENVLVDGEALCLKNAQPF